MPLILNGTTGISGTDGSASIPAVQGTDANTGMFFPAADTIAFAEGGTEVMRIDASGNVGIGTSSPGVRLDVQTPGGTATRLRWLQAGVTNYEWQIPASVDAFALVYGGATERMRITAAGDVGIGTSSPRARLDIAGGELKGVNNIGGNANNAAYSIWGGSDSLNGGYVQLYGGSHSVNPSVVLFGNSAGGEAMRINVDRRVSIGSTAVNALLTVDGIGPQLTGQGFAFYSQSGNNTLTGYAGGQTINNSIWASSRVSAGEFNARSDRRLKTDIAPIPVEDAFRLIESVPAVHYKWKNSPDGGVKFGFIAQDLVKAGFPNLVGAYQDTSVQEETDADGLTSVAGVAMTVNYDQIIPVLAVTIKELKAEVDALKARIAALEAR